MDKYFDILLRSNLFKGLNKTDLQSFLSCANYRITDYLKGETILLSGQDISEIGILLSGKIEASQEDFSGNRVIISRLCAPELFAEILACSSEHRSIVTVTALTDTKVLYLDSRKVSVYCSKGCLSHQKIIQNMLNILADKYFSLNKRIGLLMKKSVRKKLSVYLLNESKTYCSRTFPATLSKTSLAFFLNADRSAMSRELSRMKAEGLIDFNRDSYSLLQPDLLKEIT